jgi:hypothetical protein
VREVRIEVLLTKFVVALLGVAATKKQAGSTRIDNIDRLHGVGAAKLVRALAHDATGQSIAP